MRSPLSFDSQNRTRRCLFTCVLSLACHWPSAHSEDDIYAVQSRASTPNFQLFLNLEDDADPVSSGPLFGPAGGIYGLTHLDGVIYAAELDSSTSEEYLATIPHVGQLVGQGSRVSANPIGFSTVESLAAAAGVIYGTSINFSTHRTTLITIDPITGIGTGIGVGDFDVIIVGLAFDPLAEILYGAGVPFGGTGIDTPNLYTLDRATGDTTLIGDLGVELQSLAWDTELGLIGAFDRLYEIDTATGAASQIGTADFTDGIPGAFNGIYSLAAIVNESGPSVDTEPDGDVDGTDFLTIQSTEPSLIPTWELEYGTGFGSLATSQTVPEPTSSTSVVLAMVCLLARLRRNN